MEVGEEFVILYLSLHCHHQNDSCIEVGSDESHFKFSLIVMDKVPRPQLLKRKESRSKFEPRSPCLPALPLGQNGSRTRSGILQAACSFYSGLITDRFYIALFSAVEQTHCARI